MGTLYSFNIRVRLIELIWLQDKKVISFRWYREAYCLFNEYQNKHVNESYFNGINDY